MSMMGDEVLNIRLNTVVANNASALQAMEAIRKELELLVKTSKTIGSVSLFARVDQEARKAASTLQSVEKQLSRNTAVSNVNVRAMNATAESMRRLNEAGAIATKNQVGKYFDLSSRSGQKASAEYAQNMKDIGLAVMAAPRSFAHFITNMRTMHQGLKDTSISGYATAKSIHAMAGGAPTVVQGFSAITRAGILIRTAKSNLDSLTDSWQRSVQTSQWAGRQMIQGISIPLLGIATRAISAWRGVETEILSIKKVTDFSGLKDIQTGIVDTDYSKLRKEINATAMEYGAATKAVAHTYQEVVQLGVRGSQNVKAYVDSVQNLSLLGNMDTDSAFQFFRTTKALFADKPGTSMLQSIEKANGVMAQLNAIADNTSVKLSDLAAGIPEVAPVMSQMGFSAAETAASLAGMYNRGIPATEAAHGLKFALQRLINPTKESQKVIDRLKFSLFNADGSMSDASAKMFDLSLQFKGMNDQQRAQVAPELFGSRQAARMNSYFNDVAFGAEELQKLQNKTIRLDEVTSDFLKGLIYSGEIKIPHLTEKEINDPVQRYKRAVAEYKKDPTIALGRIKTAIQQVFIQIGANIAPTLISVGEKLTNFLKKIQDAPPIVYKLALAFGAFVAIMGPVKYSFAMVQYAGLAFINIATRMIPSLKGITNAQALMNAQLMTTNKVGFLGGRTFLTGLGGPINALKAKLQQFNLIRVGGEKAVAAAAMNNVIATDALGVSMLGTAAAAEVEIATLNQGIVTNAGQITSRELIDIAALGQATSVSINATAVADETVSLAANTSANFTNAASKAVNTQATYASSGAALAATRSNNLLNKSAPVVLFRGMYNGMKKTGGYVVEGFRRIGPAAQTGFASASSFIASGFSKMKTLFTGGFSGIAAGLSGLWTTITTGLIGGTIAALSWIAVIVAAVVAVVVVLVILFKGIKNHWGQIMAAMKPGIDALKAGFERVKAALAAVVDRFKEIIGQLGSGGSEGEKASSVWEGIGAAAGKVAEIIGTALGWIGNLIGWLMPYFEIIAYTVKDLVGFVFALFTGDWQKAIHFAVAVVYEMVRPVVIVAQTIARVFATMVDKILGGASAILKVVGLGDVGKSLDNWGNSMRDFASDPSWVRDLDNNLRSGLGGVFGEAIHAEANNAKSDAQKAGGDLGDEAANAMDNSFAESASGTSWVEAWISKVYGNLDKELERIKKSAMDSLQKAQDAAIKVYDDRIKAIENQEKAEEKLFKTEEYLSKRRELLAKRDLDNNNYRKARYIAIYEGRYDDARKLDLEHSKANAENTKSINDLDAERNKDLIKAERDAKKDQINIEKEAAQAAWEIRKKSLEDQIDLIVRYAPETVAEFQSMMDRINQVVSDNGGQWPEYAKGAMDRMLEVFQDSNRQISDEFLRSGKDARASWMIGFAQGETITILAASGSSGTGGTGGIGGGATGAATDTVRAALDSMTEEQKASFQAFVNGVTQGTAEQAAAAYGYVNGEAPGGQYIQTPYDENGIMSQDAQAQAYANLYGTGLPFTGAINKDLSWSQRQLVEIVKEQIRQGNDINKNTEEYAIALHEINNQLEADRRNKKAADKEVEDAKLAFAAALKRNTEEENRRNAEGAVALYGSYAHESTLPAELSSGQATEKAVADFLKSLVKPFTTSDSDRVSDVINSATGAVEAHSSIWKNSIEQVMSMTDTVETAISRSIISAGQDTTKALGSTTRSMKTFVDEDKRMWFEVNGQIVDEYGNTATFIQDENDKTKGKLIDSNGKILQSSVNTFTKGQEVVDYMNKNGLDPASDKAQFFKERLNEIGGVVKELDGKSIYIDLDMGSSDFWTRFDTLNAWSKTFEAAQALGSMFGNEVRRDPVTGHTMIKYSGTDQWVDLGAMASIAQKATGGAYKASVGAFKMAMGGAIQYAGGGSLVKNRKNGILANIGEGGYDEYVITTDPRYRAANLGYLTAAAAQLGIRSQASNAMRVALGSQMMLSGAKGSSGSSMSGGGGDVYINVDTFIGEEAWFNELMKKYDMKITPQERRKIGQQRRTISSYNDRYSIK